MTSKRWPLRSLSTRVTLFTLLIFVVSIWTQAFYAQKILQSDMQALLSEQQFSTASIVAANIHQNLQERQTALSSLSLEISPPLFNNDAALQSFLEKNNIFQTLFNGGLFITEAQGTVLASIPSAARRRGVNYLDGDFIAATLKEGKSVIGKPLMGKQLHAPIFVMTVPIRNRQGEVIGCLAGVINLGLANFLDGIIGHSYGKNGGYLLIAPEQQLIVSASDKHLIMTHAPLLGMTPLLDRFNHGFEGTGIAVNSLKIEVLAAAKRVPLANWTLIVTLPTTEAFAPITTLERRMFLITIVMTLLASVLSGWILKQQLSPLRSAVKLLNQMASSEQIPQALPIYRDDEIGQLLKSFNHLLKTLAEREDALIQSEYFLRAMTENIPCMVAYWTPELRCTFANKAYSSWFKRPLGQMQNISMQDLLDEALFQKISPYVKGVLQGEDQHYERTVINDRGETIYLFAQYIAHHIENQVQGFFVLLTDITSVKLGQEQLKLSDLTLKSISQGVIISDADKRILSVNDALLDITGYSKEDFLGNSCHFLQGPLSNQDTIAAIRSALKKGMSFSGEMINYRKDGSIFWNDLTISPVFSEKGKISHFIGITRDITTRKNAETELLLKQTQLQGMIDTAMDAIVSTDAQFNIILFNGAAEKMFGYSTAHIMGCPIEILIPDKLAQGHRQQMHHFANQEENPRQMRGRSVRPVLGKRADGSEFPAEVTISYAQNNGRPIFTAMVRDITERKALDESLMQFATTLELRVIERTQALEAAKLQAENANQAKSMFLANMSHEIRTPLNSVLGMAHLAQLTELNTKQQDYLQKIMLSGTHLLDLINDILDFSKIEAGKLELHLTDFSLSELINHVHGLTQHRAEEKGLQLKIEIDPHIPDYLHGDDLRIKQVLINLLSNAIKFTEQGEVSLSLQAKENVFLFRVSDSGIGISAEAQTQLFQSFQQADNSITRKYGGTGLGLAISHQLVQLMGGELAVQSTLGQGSDFHFQLSLPPAHHAPNPLHSAFNPDKNEHFLIGKRILLADDHPFNQQIGSELLEIMGAEVVIANNGLEAIQLASQSNFDLILLDVQMPEMDGVSACQYLRKDPSFDSVPIVAMTANLSLEDQQRYAAAGMAHFISKPVQAEKLYRTLADCLALNSPTLPKEEQPPILPDGLIDHAELLNMLGDDKERQKKYCAKFVLALQEGLALIHQAMMNQETPAIRQESHRLKAIAHTVGAMPLGAMLAKIEKNTDTAQLAEEIAGLNTLFQQSCDELRLLGLYPAEHANASPSI